MRRWGGGRNSITGEYTENELDKRLSGQMTRVHTSTVRSEGVRVCEPEESFPRSQGGGLGKKNSQTLSFCLLKMYFFFSK